MPTPVQLSQPELTINGNEALVATNLTGVRPSGQIRFRFPAGYAPDQSAMNDAVFSIGLMLAMATGRRLALGFPVSDQLVRAARTVNEIYTNWFPSKLSPVAIDVPSRFDSQPVVEEKVRGISAFTGGVDSFATALRNKENIDSHFYVFGYDLPLDTEFKPLRDNVRANLRQAADRMQKRIIFVTTNVRTYLNPHTNWASMSHGPAIAAVGHLLSSIHNRLYIPSSFTYNDLQPWGSHPLTDPLWSSARLGVVHDGAHLSRVEKTIQIADEPAVQNHLRVCLSKRTEYNCGKCVKCLRTMLGLELAGELKGSQVFPSVLDLDVVRDIELTTLSQVIFMDQLVEHSVAYGRNDIAEALEVSIARFRGSEQGKAGADGA
ncbi:hypothetical protein G3H63_15770 [Microbacterium resistens]|uniref:hypothetical protein n=1 Tax=Microbacterium resistens TaxID=156977 RepID=UPI001C5713B9|nr:hypothetical protein [Microbacterium resistens]MBW1640521.1 hypothetical protein [Microbacterium resistens]